MKNKSWPAELQSSLSSRTHIFKVYGTFRKTIWIMLYWNECNILLCSYTLSIIVSIFSNVTVVVVLGRSLTAFFFFNNYLSDSASIRACFRQQEWTKVQYYFKDCLRFYCRANIDRTEWSALIICFVCLFIHVPTFTSQPLTMVR